MELYIFLFCISLLLLFLHRSSTRSLPPGPINLPIIGSLHRLGSHPNQSLFELAKIYGPLMTLLLGYVTTTIASSAETAKQVLQSHEQTFSDRTVPDIVASQPNPESTLAWAVGDSRWRNRRRICNTQLFTVQRLNSLQHLRHQKVQQLIEHIKKQRISGCQVNIGQVAFATALNLISTTIFSMDIVDPEFSTAQEFKDLVEFEPEDAGQNSDESEPESDDTLNEVEESSPEIFQQPESIATSRPKRHIQKPARYTDMVAYALPFDLQGIRKHIRPSYMRLHEIFDEIIDKRMEGRASDSMTRSGDLLDVLLDQCEENGSNFSRQNIKPLILDLFIAGSDTSAITTEWAMAELFRKPEVLQKTRRELIEVIGSERAVKESDMDQLPYLQTVVKETMRFHPAAPLLLPYKAKIHAKICGYTIPKDTQVLVNAWAIWSRPQILERPFFILP
ncbi:hypothetical protein CRYUN_Cryun07bG0193100 [Craigia yunnanensis]